MVTTTVVNEMVDTAGITFAFRMEEDMAAGPADAARAFDAATSVFGLDEVFADIRAAAANTPAAGTDALALETRRLLDRDARWFVSERPLPLDVQDAVRRYRAPVRAHAADLRGWLRGDEVGNLDERTRALAASGAASSRHPGRRRASRDGSLTCCTSSRTWTSPTSRIDSTGRSPRSRRSTAPRRHVCASTRT